MTFTSGQLAVMASVASRPPIPPGRYTSMTSRVFVRVATCLRFEVFVERLARQLADGGDHRARERVRDQERHARQQRGGRREPTPLGARPGKRGGFVLLHHHAPGRGAQRHHDRQRRCGARPAARTRTRRRRARSAGGPGCDRGTTRRTSASSAGRSAASRPRVWIALDTVASNEWAIVWAKSRGSLAGPAERFTGTQRSTTTRPSFMTQRTLVKSA